MAEYLFTYVWRHECYSQSPLRVAERPTLKELQCLVNERNGKNIRFIKAVEGDWKKLADLLALEDRVAAINQSASGETGEACRQVMGTWLKGAHRIPVTWGVLLDVLDEMECPEISKDLELALVENHDIVGLT